MEAAAPCEGLEVGQRVQSANVEKGMQVGTVKYIGPVDGFEGQWVGVDWDGGQGRHDGVVNGRRYFDAAEARSGSLVRAHSLRAGVTLMEALNRRYNAVRSGASQGNDDMYVLSVRQRRMPVKLVGKSQVEARQKQLQKLFAASLAYSGVRSVGPPGEIRALAANIQDLDLTGNLLPDWHAVCDLCAELPSLDVLTLSSSRPHLRWEAMVQTPINVKILVLNNCHISWRQVEHLKSSLSTVEELHLCGNKIAEIECGCQLEERAFGSSFVHGFESLRMLNLENNCLENWEEVLKLSQLKRLEHLNLNSNSIRQVSYPGPVRAGHYNKSELERGKSSAERSFGCLRCLLLGKNSITEWTSIDALNMFPALEELRLSDNPISRTVVGGTLRYMLIARIKRMNSLNGSEIKPRERRDAEIRYVRHVLSGGLSPGRMEELEKVHPRLAELRISHDVPVESAHNVAAQSSKPMTATLLSVSIHCVSSSAGEKPALTRRLPLSTKVGKLKQICEALFKVKATKQRLYIKDQDPMTIPLDDDMDTLGDLGIASGAIILVDDAN